MKAFVLVLVAVAALAFAAGSVFIPQSVTTSRSHPPVVPVARDSSEMIWAPLKTWKVSQDACTSAVATTAPTTIQTSLRSRRLWVAMKNIRKPPAALASPDTDMSASRISARPLAL